MNELLRDLERFIRQKGMDLLNTPGGRELVALFLDLKGVRHDRG
jgi:hypothetical protein